MGRIVIDNDNIGGKRILKDKDHKISCENCEFGVPTSLSEKTYICNNHNVWKSLTGKAIKHGMNFSCGYGEKWVDDGWREKSRQLAKKAEAEQTVAPVTKEQ